MGAGDRNFFGRGYGGVDHPHGPYKLQIVDFGCLVFVTFKLDAVLNAFLGFLI